MSSGGVKRVLPSYFGAVANSTVLGAGWELANPRTEPVLVFKKHGKTCLESGDFVHLLKVSTDFVAPTYSTDRRTISTPAPLIIDGVGVQAGDRIEISASLATALNAPPGVWLADSDRQITLEKAPVYTLTSPWDCGSPWSYRIDAPTGELVGVAPIAFTLTDTWNKNPSAQIKNAARIFDTDFWSQGDHSLISWAGYRIDFNEVTVRRMAIYTRSIKVPGENYKPSRFKVSIPGGSVLTNLFYSLDTGVQASGSVYTFALASTETWITRDMERKITALSFDDEANSRGYTSICSYGDLPCRISIKGVNPPTGAEVVISEAVATQFFPAIAAGTYNVTQNANNEQWRLQKQ
jgi:hypothetical protein